MNQMMNLHCLVHVHKEIDMVNVNCFLNLRSCLLNWSYTKILIFGIGITMASVMMYNISLPPFFQFYETHGNESKDVMNPILNDYGNSKSQVYEIIGDIRIHGKSSTIWVASDREELMRSWTTKPHARLFDNGAMYCVTEINITMNYADLLPKCTQYFNVPTIIFSVGGYFPHTYHGMADVIVPLYFTSHQFKGSVIFQLLDAKPGWISRYELIFRKLSNYDTVDLANESEVQCFSRVIVGLDADENEFRAGPKHFTDHTMMDFTRFIRNTYSLERHSVEKRRDPHRLLIISRKKTRVLLNEEEIAEACERIGFDVNMSEIEGDFNYIAHYINSFDVIVGVHGAGLTNMIFLPENALVIQIIPYGMRDLAIFYYGLPEKEMNLRYLDHEITWEESSLSSKYSIHDQVYIDPTGILTNDWGKFQSIYHYQNVNVNVTRFENVLLDGFLLMNS